MRRGLVLSFEPRLESHIRNVWKSVEKEGIGITPGQLLEAPHITIAEATSDTIEPLWQAALETQFSDKDLQLVPFGVFLGKRNIAFYNVVLSERLHRAYLAYYDILRRNKAAHNPLYDPSHILFHCTITIDVEETELVRLVELLSRERESQSGCVAAIELWEHHPTKKIHGRSL